MHPSFPLLVFQSPFARHWFDTTVYLMFVSVYSIELVAGPDASGLGAKHPIVAAYAWAWTVGSWVAKSRAGPYKSKRVLFVL